MRAGGAVAAPGEGDGMRDRVTIHRETPKMPTMHRAATVLTVRLTDLIYLRRATQADMAGRAPATLPER
jgi:hypothetical protein